MPHLSAGGRLTTENKYIYIQAPLFFITLPYARDFFTRQGDVDCEEAAQVTGTDTK